MNKKYYVSPLLQCIRLGSCQQLLAGSGVSEMSVEDDDISIEGTDESGRYGY